MGGGGGGVIVWSWCGVLNDLCSMCNSVALPGISDGVSAAAKPGSGKATGGQGRTPDPAQRRGLAGSGASCCSLSASRKVALM